MIRAHQNKARRKAEALTCAQIPAQGRMTNGELMVRATVMAREYARELEPLKDDEKLALLVALVEATYQERARWSQVSRRLLERALGQRPWDSRVYDDADVRELIESVVRRWQLDDVRAVLLQPVSASGWQRLLSLTPLSSTALKALKASNRCDLACLYHTLASWLRVACPYQDDALSARRDQLQTMRVRMGNGVMTELVVDSLWDSAQKHWFVSGAFALNCEPVPLERGELDVERFVQDALLRDLCALLDDALCDLSGYPFFRDWTQAYQVPSWSALVSALYPGTSPWLGAPLVLRLQVLQLVLQRMPQPCCQAVDEHPLRRLHRAMDWNHGLRVDWGRLANCALYDTDRAFAVNWCAQPGAELRGLRVGARETRLLLPRHANVLVVAHEVFHPEMSMSEWKRVPVRLN